MKTIKIQATSDTHGNALPLLDTSAKVFVHAGDINGRSYTNYKSQFTDIKDMFFALSVQCAIAKKEGTLELEEIFINFGNHETLLDTVNYSPYTGRRVHSNNQFTRVKLASFFLEQIDHFKNDFGITLHLAVDFIRVELNGKMNDSVKTEVKIIDSPNLGRVLMIPFTPPVNNPEVWGNVWTPSDLKQKEVLKILEKDNEIDVVISHGPPHGTADDIAGMTPNYKRVGDNFIKYLLDEVIEPKLFICGHIHESYGPHKKEDTGLPCDLYCVAHMDHEYNPVNKPITIEYEKE